MNQLILPLRPQAQEHPHTCCTSDSYLIAGLGQTLVFWQDRPVQKDGLSVLLDGVYSTQSMKIGASGGKVRGSHIWGSHTPLYTLRPAPATSCLFSSHFSGVSKSLPCAPVRRWEPRPHPRPAWNCVKCPWDCGDLGYSPEIAALPLPTVGSGLACVCGLRSWSQPIPGGALQPTPWACTWGTMHHRVTAVMAQRAGPLHCDTQTQREHDP